MAKEATGSRSIEFLTETPGSALVEFAAARSLELLVMGAAARPRSMNTVIGDTAASALSPARCDLLVVKHPQFVCLLLSSRG